MDEDEDLEALFFSEARELLDALQEHLNLLDADEGDDETVHAAFRAVHSVKGGAAAFGFDRLISFAHIFETVMDLIRSDSLALDDQICQILLRSGDMMQVLVENAQAGVDDEIQGIRRLTEELEALASQGGAPMANEVAAEPATAPAVDAGDPEPAAREIEVRITPEPDFFDAGHDLLRLIRAAREIGLVAVHCEGEIPPIAEFDPRRCPLSWELRFQTEQTPSDIAAFFDIYSHLAAIEFIQEETGAAGDEAVGTAPAEDEPDDGAAGSAPDADAPGGKPPAGGSSRGSGGGRGDMAKSLRVEIARIDRLVNLVGEMLITQAALAQRVSDADDQAADDMAHTVDTMSRQLRELQESVMAIRAQPVKSVFRRMPRVVRDLAETLGKDARLEVSGEHTEVDATVIEELSEPLTHMIRNSMDHGLESNDDRAALGKPRVGVIRLSAEHRGERVIITVEDDGRGVDRDRVRAKAIERGLISADDQLAPEDIDALIFHPGFSTASEVSSVSGRGVGMDVVKKKIVSLGGRCALYSTPGKGTRFVITLPLTLAVMDGMTIRVGAHQYILPLSTVVEAMRVQQTGGHRLPDGSRLLERRGEYIKLISLRDALDLPQSGQDSDMAIIVDTESQGHVALIVDELIGQRQIVLKSLETNFRQVHGVSGATILGDGQVALILDVPALMGAGGGQYSAKEILH